MKCNYASVSLFVLLVSLATASVHGQTVQVPGPPLQLVCQVNGNVVQCTWQPPASANAASYQLEVDPDGDSSRRIIYEASGLSATITLPDGLYQAQVVGYNLGGRGAVSSRVEILVPGLVAPRNLMHTIGGDAVTLTWDAPIGGTAPQRYEVEIGVPGAEVPCPSTSPCAPTRTVNADLSRNVTVSLPTGVYVARVRGVVANVRGAASTDITFIIGPPPTGAVPFPPSGLRAEVRDTTVTLMWNLRQDSPQVTNYLIDVGEAPFVTFNTGSPALSVTAIAAPGRYPVRIRAQNAHGISQLPSETIVVGVRQEASCNTTLGAPTGLTAARSGNVVTLTWARPSLDVNLSSYLVQVGSSSGLSNVFDFATGNQATLISGAVPSGTYFIRVRAQDFCSQSAPSNEIVVTVP